ncbi:MAG: LemA family protein [Alphaproteobacteria bacterium]|nr:LemA family protein [Alphaproteobacteria bacterium]
MLIALIILAVLALYGVSVYNGLVKNRQQVKEAWSTIDTQLKRRYDLIPNLVETVKGYASHESGTLEKVIQARATAMSQTGAKDKGKAEEGLTGALKSIFALGESYPELKANTNFLSLQQELSDTETKIQASRQFYNTVVMGLNSKIEMFPSNIFAKLFHFEKADFFELSGEEAKAAQQAPQVKF